MTKAYKFVEDHRAKYTDSVVSITHDVGTIHGLLDGMQGGLFTKQSVDEFTTTVRQYLDRIISNKTKLREVCGTMVDRYAAIDRINDGLHEDIIGVNMENDRLKQQHKETKDEVVQMQRRLDKLMGEGAKTWEELEMSNAAVATLTAENDRLKQRLAAMRLALPDGSVTTMAAADRAPGIIANNLRCVLNNVEYIRKIKPRDNESLDDFADRLDAAVATSVQYARDGVASVEGAVEDLQRGYEMLRKAFKDADFIRHHEQMADVVLQTAAIEDETISPEAEQHLADRMGLPRTEAACLNEMTEQLHGVNDTLEQIRELIRNR